MHTSDIAVGIDVGKHAVVIAVTPSGEQWTSATTPDQLEGTMARIAHLRPTVVVLEATGGYEAPVAAAGAAAQAAGDRQSAAGPSVRARARPHGQDRRH